MWLRWEIFQIWVMPFFSEGGRCLPSWTNKDIFNFENGYTVPPRNHRGVGRFGMSESTPLFCSQDVNSLTEWGMILALTDVGINRCRLVIPSRSLCLSFRSEGLVSNSCCNLVRRKLRGFNYRWERVINYSFIGAHIGVTLWALPSLLLTPPTPPYHLWKHWLKYRRI